MKPFTLLTLIVMLTALLGTSCEKEVAALIEKQDTEASVVLDARSSDQYTHNNLFVQDSNIYHLVRLMTTDNRLINLYLDGVIDTSDVFAIYDRLYMPDDNWVNDSFPPEADYYDFLTFMEENYSSDSLDLYFQEMGKHMRNLLSSLISEYGSLSQGEIQDKITEAAQIIFQTHFEERFLAERSGQCQLCWAQFNTCRQTVNQSAGATFGVGTMAATAIVLYTGYTGPVSWGTALITYVSHSVGAGMQWAIGTSGCRNALVNCLQAHGCPGVGGMGGGGGVNPLEVIGKT